MDQLTAQYNDIKQIEASLPFESDTLSRIRHLTRLAQYYIFTDIAKAQEILAALEALLIEKKDPDFLVNYFLCRGFYENQVYKHERAEKHFLKALNLIEERGDINQQLDAYLDVIGVALNLQKRKMAEKHLEKAKKLIQVFPNEKFQARILIREGYMNLQFYKNQTDAIACLLKAESLLTPLKKKLDIKDHHYLALAYSGLGTIYEKNDDHKKVIIAYRSAIEICEELNMRTRISWHYLHLGNALMANGNLEKARWYFQKVLGASDDTSKASRALALGNLGYIHIENNEFDKALKQLDKAESVIKEKSGDIAGSLASIDTWRGLAYSKMDNPKKAIYHYDRAYNNAKEAADFGQLCNICRNLSAIFVKKKDYENAYTYQSMFNQYFEKYHEEVKNRKTEELEIKYEAEKRKQEAELHRLQSIRLQLKALRAQMNPHFMHNALNSIQDYISSGDTTNASIFLAKFAGLMRQSLDYSDLETISLEREVEFLRDYLELNKKLRFDERMDYKIEIDEEIEEDIFCVPTMIVQPYVENSIEHGIRSRQQGFIHLSFKMKNEHTLLCVVEDNGIGRVAAAKAKLNDPGRKKHRSRGTAITEERLHILNGGESKLFVNTIDLIDDSSGKPHGTRVEIEIPIVDVTVK